jgi:hypothetical protein
MAVNYQIDPLTLHRLNPARYPYLLESVVYKDLLEC